MKIEPWKLDRIHLYENNPRLNDEAVEAVVASIREFGFRQPIVVDTDGVIICGHTRYKAALKLGLEKAPVHVAKDLSPEQIKAYRIADILWHVFMIMPVSVLEHSKVASDCWQRRVFVR